MFCTTCGNKLEDQGVVCPRCGTAVAAPPPAAYGPAWPSPPATPPVGTPPPSSFQLPPTQVLGGPGQGNPSGVVPQAPGPGRYPPPPSLPSGSGAYGPGGYWPPGSGPESPGQLPPATPPGAFQPAALLEQLQGPRPAPSRRSASPLLLLLMAALAAVALIGFGVHNLRSSPSPSGTPSPSGPTPATSPSTPQVAATSPTSPPPPASPLPSARSTAPEEGPPQDEVLVLEQLTKLEVDWAEANFRADRSALDRILADDFSCKSQGQHLDKQRFIDTTTRDEQVQRWRVGGMRLLSLDVDRAVVQGELDATYPSGQKKFRFTDSFVYRQGRWQATGTITEQVY